MDDEHELECGNCGFEGHLSECDDSDLDAAAAGYVACPQCGAGIELEG